MARHHQRHPVRCAGAGHGSRRIGLAHLTRHFAIAARLSARNLLAAPATRATEKQFRADPATVPKLRGAGQIRAVTHARERLIHQSRDSDGSRRNSAAGNSARRLASASARCRSERQPAEPAFCAAHDNPSKRGRAGGPADALAFAALRKFRRRHAQLSAFISAARRTETRFINRVRHAVLLLQRSAQPARSAAIAGIAAGSLPSPA